MPLIPVKNEPSLHAQGMSPARYNLIRAVDACTAGDLSKLLGEDPQMHQEGAQSRRVVYGPGRGDWVEGNPKELKRLVDPFMGGEHAARDPELGAWVVTTGAGGLRKPSNIVGGGNRPSFHCSSFTNWILGVYFGVTNWSHYGNIPPLEAIVTNGGLFTWRSTSSVYRNVRGFGEWMHQIHPDGTTAAQHKLRGKWVNRLLDAEELWRRRSELSEITVVAQTSRTKTGWNYEHHTALFIRHQKFPDSLIRVAADGYKVSRSTYQPVPMDIEVVNEAEALRLEPNRLYAVWTVDERTFNPHNTLIRPILMEPASK